MAKIMIATTKGPVSATLITRCRVKIDSYEVTVLIHESLNRSNQFSVTCDRSRQKIAVFNSVQKHFSRLDYAGCAQMAVDSVVERYGAEYVLKTINSAPDFNIC